MGHESKSEWQTPKMKPGIIIASSRGGEYLAALLNAWDRLGGEYDAWQEIGVFLISALRTSEIFSAQHQEDATFICAH